MARDRRAYMRDYMRRVRAQERQRHFSEEPRAVQAVTVLPVPQKPPQPNYPPASTARVRQFTAAEAAYWDRVNQSAFDSVYGSGLPVAALRPRLGLAAASPVTTVEVFEAPDGTDVLLYFLGALLAGWLLWKLLGGKPAPLPVVAEAPNFSAWFPEGI